MTAIIASGCAPTIQAARVEQVKRLAIVSYQASIQRSSGNSTAPLFHVRAAETSNSAQADAVYKRLADKLHTQFGWIVLERDAVASNPAYQEAVQSRRGSGFLASMNKLDQATNGSYYPEGILTQYQGLQLTPEDLAQLEQGLDVDAIALAYISLTPASGWSVGGGAFSATRYSAQLTFIMYDRDTGEPIWRDRWAKGKRGSATQSVNLGIVSLGNGDKDMIAFYEAIENAYEALLARYTKHAHAK